MAVSQNQRLRKAAAKAAKRKAVVAEKLGAQRRELAISKPRHVDLATSPVVACTMTQGFEEEGAGTLTLIRQLTLGRYGACIFDIDLWCLGVEDAYFEVLEAEDYEYYQAQPESLARVPMDPALARQLVRDAAAYGARNGFPPPDEFGEMESFFGAIEPAGATFPLGRNGKPYFVVNPNDPPARVRRTLEHLEYTLGPGGFEYEYPLDEDVLPEEKPPTAEASRSAIAPPSRSSARRATGSESSRRR
jgi:hypothetical protein